MSKSYLERLHNKRGTLRHQVVAILEYRECKTLEELKAKADAGEIYASDVARYSVVGQALACYLFPAYAAKVEERATNKANGGTYRRKRNGGNEIFGFHGGGI